MEVKNSGATSHSSAIHHTINTSSSSSSINLDYSNFMTLFWGVAAGDDISEDLQLPTTRTSPHSSCPQHGLHHTAAAHNTDFTTQQLPTTRTSPHSSCPQHGLHHTAAAHNTDFTTQQLPTTRTSPHSSCPQHGLHHTAAAHNTDFTTQQLPTTRTSPHSSCPHGEYLQPTRFDSLNSILIIAAMFKEHQRNMKKK
nr:mucin-6-like [Cherax quadricarinatus]